MSHLVIFTMYELYWHVEVFRHTKAVADETCVFCAVKASLRFGVNFWLLGSSMH